jgi:thiol-disulfide isomerase/thioredoxin
LGLIKKLLGVARTPKSFARVPELSLIILSRCILCALAYSFNSNSKPLPNQAVLIHFWATWCSICRLENDNIQAISQDYRVLNIAMQSGTDTELHQKLHDGFTSRFFNIHIAYYRGSLRSDNDRLVTALEG